jgi:hypothetical protein
LDNFFDDTIYCQKIIKQYFYNKGIEINEHTKK